MSKKTAKWRKNEFHYLQEMMYRKQIEEKIELYDKYLDVLNYKEKKELIRLEQKQKSFLIIGKTSKSK